MPKAVCIAQIQRLYDSKFCREGRVISTFRVGSD